MLVIGQLGSWESWKGVSGNVGNWELGDWETGQGVTGNVGNLAIG